MSEPQGKAPIEGSFALDPVRFEITWQGIVIEILYRPPFAHFYVEHPIAYLEVRSIEPIRAPLPITGTGYVSRVIPGIHIEAEGGPVAYVQAWLDSKGKSGKWK